VPRAPPAAAPTGLHGVQQAAASAGGGSESTVASAQPPPATSSDCGRALDHLAACQAWGLPSNFDPSLLSRECVHGAALLDELRSEPNLQASGSCEHVSFPAKPGAAGLSGETDDTGSEGLGGRVGGLARSRENLAGCWEKLSSVEHGGQGEGRQGATQRQRALAGVDAGGRCHSSSLLAALSQEGFAELQLVRRV
jgi:hypothetical protein